MPGVMEFDFGMAAGRRSQRVETTPFVMLVLGDFSGNAGGRSADDPAWLLQVPIKNVDIDNIDQLWKVFEPRLKIEIEHSSIELEPRDLEDFHPDHLFNSLPIFGELRKLRKRLLDPETSAEALAEVTSAAPDTTPDTEPGTDDERPGSESGDQMFERLLGERRAPAAPVAAAQTRLDSLLHRLVAPHIVYELDPKVDTAVDAVDLGIASTMRSILHHPDFQQLEGAWRSLYDLVHATEIGDDLQLKVCNVSKHSLLNGLPARSDSLADSGLYQLLVGRFRRGVDDADFSLLLCQFFFGGSADDMALLAVLGTLAEVHDAAVIAAAKTELIGTQSLAQQPAASDWSTQDNPFWRQLRASPVATRIGLTLPRILGRLPYGKDTEAIDSFDFEELDSLDHENFLWTNPTLACAGLLAQGFTGSGWNLRPGQHTDIGDLPVFTYTHEGEKKMLPCAELLLPARSAEALLGLGIMPLVSFRNRDMVRLLRFQSIASPLAALAGPWND